MNHVFSFSRLSFCSLFLLCFFTTAVHANPLATTIFVKDANGNAVEGATVCIGSSIALDEFGTGTTDHLGQAIFNAALPTPPATVYITASSGIYNGQIAQPLSGTIAPPNLFATVELSSTPGGTSCPGGFQGISPAEVSFSPVWEVDIDEVFAGQVFEIQLVLEQLRNRRPYPPPSPLPVRIESSNPRVLTVPRGVTFGRGQSKQGFKAEVSSNLKTATTVTLRAYVEGQRPVELRLKVQPGREAPGGRRN